VCQHGLAECQANDYEMCVVNSFPHAVHQMQVTTFIYCLEITNQLNMAAAPVSFFMNYYFLFLNKLEELLMRLPFAVVAAVMHGICGP
jgi:hypothetical protein